MEDSKELKKSNDTFEPFGFLNEQKEIVDTRFDHFESFKNWHNEHYNDIDSFNNINILDSLIGLASSYSVPNTLVMLFSVNKFQFLYLSDNVEQLMGYTLEEVYSAKRTLLFKIVSWKHLDFPFIALNWKRNFVKENPKAFENGLKSYYCGLHVKNAQGETKIMLLRIRYYGNIIDGGEQNLLFFANDVSHLVKGGFYWGRYLVKDEVSGKFYSSDKEYKGNGDIFSERELEVLKLIEELKTNVEIGEQLFISPNTVQQHRKNMLAKTGALDMTALVQICKLIEIL